MWDLSSLTRGELASLALEAQSLNCWTAKEAPVLSFIKQAKIIIKAPQPQMIQAPEFAPAASGRPEYGWM